MNEMSTKLALPLTSETPRSYVVAVSGGVDSMVLLHIMYLQSQQHTGMRLIVAHFDHGVREDSAEDRHLVERQAKAYGLPFVYDRGYLGADVSELAAREARYKFLRRVKDSAEATYIATAHHEDDVFETAIINLLRGTGRKGLTALRTRDDLYRPLIKTPKAHIRVYADRNAVEWREDSTNLSDDYLRNYVRHNIMPKFDAVARDRLRRLLETTHETNEEIDSLLAEQLHLQPAGDILDRQWFIMLPHAVAREIVAAWLRKLGVANFDKQTLERITIAAKTYLPGKQIDINARFIVAVYMDRLVMRARA
jgi:tRNA(Ile)-lysidine synthase